MGREQIEEAIKAMRAYRKWADDGTYWAEWIDKQIAGLEKELKDVRDSEQN